MHRLWAALTLAVTLGASAASAQDRPVVVELYTSQGCSSCPPADALLAELAQRDDVIALALHVDYWDYIGWKDVFGSPINTMRQKGYARAAGHRTVYTPQMIVGGTDHVVGYKPMKLAELIEIHKEKVRPLEVSARRVDGEIEISVAAAGGTFGETVVQVVHYRPEAAVDIRRGENAGHRYVYHNIVTDWHVIGGWNGSGAMRIRTPSINDGPAVVILQAPGHGAILAAARVE